MLLFAFLLVVSCSQCLDRSLAPLWSLRCWTKRLWPLCRPSVWLASWAKRFLVYQWWHLVPVWTNWWRPWNWHAAATRRWHLYRALDHRCSVSNTNGIWMQYFDAYSMIPTFLSAPFTDILFALGVVFWLKLHYSPIKSVVVSTFIGYRFTDDGSSIWWI